jgi:hypothetical protein
MSNPASTKLKHLAGWCLLSSPFVLFVILSSARNGIAITLAKVVIIIAIAAVLALGLKLVME